MNYSNKIMENFIKENWFKISLLIILVISAFGAFYWFEIRPSEIRKYCLNASTPDSYNRDLFWNNYKVCLADKGLKE